MAQSPVDPYEPAYEAGFEDDISKIRRLIQYRPVVDLTEMLERVSAYTSAEGACRQAEDSH
jgi:hypothetical protein